MSTSTAYDNVEAGIVEALTDTGSPFKTVVAFGAQLSDAELATELERLVRVAPAALVLYAGGETNEGKSGSLDEDAIYHVVCIAAGRTRETVTAGDAVSPGVYELLTYCRENLHNVTTLTGVNNPLLWRGNRRVHLPGAQLTVAAFAAEFRAPLNWADGPVD